MNSEDKQQAIHRYEIAKIAHVLGESVDRLQFLEKLTESEILFLEQKITDSIQREQSPIWERLAKISSYVPGFVAAKICEEMLGPVITANITYYTPVKQAVSISGQLSLSFLAEVSEHLIPEKTAPLLKAYPLRILKNLLKHYIKNKNYYLMGTFVEQMPEDKMITLCHEIDSAEALLRSSVYVQRKDRLAVLVATFPEKRLQDLMETAHEIELWSEVLLVCAQLPSTEQQRLSTTLLKLDATQIAAARETARSLKLTGLPESFLAAS